MKPAEKKLFEALKKETVNLHMYWIIYEQLYSGSKKRIDLLNTTGSQVFYVLQILLVDEITLSVCRLTDPAFSNIRGKRYANLSLKRLIAKVDGRTFKDLKQKLNENCTELDRIVKPFRTRRNKSIAHNDLATVMKMRTQILGISRAEIRKAAKGIADTLNIFEKFHWSSSTAYDMTILPLGSDGDYLVEILKRGQWFRDLEKRNISLRDLLEVGGFTDA